MTADFQLELTLFGEPIDVKNMLEVLAHYGTHSDRDASFNFIRINGKSIDYGEDKIDLYNISDEVIASLCSAGEIKIQANGPYGRYAELNDVGLFREMAEAAPNSHFVAEIAGFQQYSVQNLKCNLENGRLKITTFFQSNEEAGEAWQDEFMAKLPMKKFKKMFAISGEDFNKDSYENVVSELDGLWGDGFEYADFDEFVSTIEDYDGEVELEEEQFKNIMENDLPSLGIINPGDFEDEYEGGETKEYIYNPISKAYEGKAKPLAEGRGPTEANELIAAGLRAQGLPADDEALANLSVEEAYAALAAAMSAGESEEDDDDDECDDDE